MFMIALLSMLVLMTLELWADRALSSSNTVAARGDSAGRLADTGCWSASG